MKSDASRYLWFDWQSRWSSVEVQPSSVARFSLLGIPYSNKYFEYNSQLGGSIKDSETYLIRLAKARKNYMSSWALTPYLYSRISNWYSTSGYTLQAFDDTSVSSVRALLNLSNKYWLRPNITYVSTQSTPTLGAVNTPGRASW